MGRVFNTTGSCSAREHYMVDITDRLKDIKALVDQGAYFTIDRARQYGKTTTLTLLADYLKDDYIVISLDFQALGNEDFENANLFSKALTYYLLNTVNNRQKPVSGLPEDMLAAMRSDADSNLPLSLRKLFVHLSEMCGGAEKPVVLLIDEIDSASNNQVFLDFLAQLRKYYLTRADIPTFRSVILAGVYDVKHIRSKIRPDDDHKVNSPWNIAADFLVDMSFSQKDIAGMLTQYEADHHTGMDITEISGLIYDYTSGYPFLVSRLCKLIDERIAGIGSFPDKKAAWTNAGFTEAAKMLIEEKNTLFDSLTGKLAAYPELKKMLSLILFEGKDIPFVATNPTIEIAAMLGFVKKNNTVVTVSNRIFESVLYNHLLSEEILNSAIYDSGLVDKNRFITNGRLDMKLVLERFVEVFDDLYSDKNEKFLEEVGRKYFMLFLKPIINGTGHSYIEARTRNMKRTDIVVEYHGEQFVIELKIWSGGKYHEDGEKQIAEYLDFYHLKTGYILTFNFNKNKEIGVKEVTFGDKLLIEATV